MLIRLSIAGLLAASISTLAAAGDRTMPELSAAPAYGKAPLAVTFTGGSGGATFFGGIQIEFGDGETGIFCRPGRSCKNATAEHVYAKAGTYAVRLVAQGEGGQRVLKELTIKAE